MKHELAALALAALLVIPVGAPALSSVAAAAGLWGFGLMGSNFFRVRNDELGWRAIGNF